MNPDLRDWLCQQLRPLVDVRFCAPPPLTLSGDRAAAPALCIGLWTGILIHVHYLDAEPGKRQLRRTLQRDEEASSASLFLLAPALAPQPGQRFAPPDWLLALHSLGNERVYVCSAPGRTPGVQPVHLEPLEGGQRHVARYGPQLLAASAARRPRQHPHAQHPRLLEHRALRRGGLLAARDKRSLRSATGFCWRGATHAA